MNHQKGFTMLEGVMVFAIIAIVAAIAVPQFRKMAINGNLKAAAKDMVSDFSYMRERAISENTSLSIFFDTTHHTYTVPYPGGKVKTPASFSSDINITGVNFTDGGTTLTFQTRGTISPPGTNTITLTNGRGSTATITVLTAGRIYVQYSLQ
ncbi:MAG: GspH/FimT family protein [Thermodesulfobacteriota bacterium]